MAGVLLSGHPALGQYVETKTGCALCHQTPQSQNDFCATLPAAIWEQDDKHKNAFFLLHESDPANPQRGAAKRELVRQILGFDLREAFADDRYSRLKDATDAEAVRRVSTVKACLRCHATWPQDTDERFSHAPPVPLELGVSCQACHGPGERWLQPHFSAAWRRVTPEAKSALGCVDCRSPVTKAKLCASCHVGNLAEGKFVKHEWYAGGHPPLPSFELASFESQMPAHWKSLREKGPFAFRDAPPSADGGLLADQAAALVRAGIPADAIKASYREANFPHAAANGLDPFSDQSRAKDAIVAGAAVLEVYSRLVGDYSAQAAENKVIWPELSLYDCTACHHELRSGLATNSRPKRSHVPGRPPLATWPTVLAQLANQQAADYGDSLAATRWSQVRDLLTQLDRATTQRPFGEPNAMREAAQSLGSSLNQLAMDANNTRFDDAASRNALQFLTSPDRYETNDFFTARQAAWTIREISRELGLREIEARFAQRANDPLALNLPSGQSQSVMENLRRWLPAAAHYDAEWFRAELKAIRESLPQ